MLRNLSQLEVTIENKNYCFFCENGSTFPHVKEALFQITKMVGQIEENIMAQQKAAEEPKAEPEAPAIEGQ